MQLWKRRKPRPSGIKKKTGFDNPLLDPANDKLGRRKFADQVYAHLTNVEHDWSVRVGLIAPWGEGKTTVAEWVATRAEKDRHIPVWYSPWRAKTDAELWLGFYNEIVRILREKGVKFNGRLLQQKVANFSANKILQTVSETNEYAKAGLGVLQAFTQITQEDIRALKTAIGDKRVIVILDDLDRVEPHLIPRLLMSLRDLMDREGFSFLLLFDDKMVSAALSKYNDASGFGNDFLEKILDYRIYLPPATENGVQALFKHEMSLYCRFISSETIDGLARFLPKNPRKLKNLVRGMRVFECEGERHRKDEIDWNALIFSLMIKNEHEVFYKQYIQDTFLAREDKDTEDSPISKPWLLADMEREKNKGDERERTRITEIMNKVDVEKEKRERIINLCEGWRTAYGSIGQHKIYYALKVLDQPEAMTWAEFDEVWRLWSNDSFGAVFAWIKKHAESLERPVENVISEFLKTASDHYNTRLEKAASVALQSEHVETAAEAEKALNFFDSFMDQDVLGLPMDKLLTVDVFEKFWHALSQWENFRGNEADKHLREKESEIVKKWISKLRTLEAQQGYASHLSKIIKDEERWRPRCSELAKELLACVSNVLERKVLDILRKENGVAELLASGAGEDVKEVLLDINSPVWNEHNKTGSVQKVLSDASANAAVQKNARYLLDLIREAAFRGTWRLRSEQVKEIYKHPEIISQIWKAAIATPLQYRRLKETRDERTHLISVGISEEHLPVPDWLKAGIKPEQDEPLPL